MYYRYTCVWVTSPDISVTLGDCKILTFEAFSIDWTGQNRILERTSGYGLRGFSHRHERRTDSC